MISAAHSPIVIAEVPLVHCLDRHPKARALAYTLVDGGKTRVPEVDAFSVPQFLRGITRLNASGIKVLSAISAVFGTITRSCRHLISFNPAPFRAGTPRQTIRPSNNRMGMVTHAQLSPSPSWSRMHAGLENPFQNNQGRFIYALPDLRSSSLFSHLSPVAIPGATGIGCSSDEPAACFPQRLPLVVPKDKDEEPPLWDESDFDPDIHFYLTQSEMESEEVKAELRLRVKQRDDDSSTPTPTSSSSVPPSPASSESSSEKEKPDVGKRPKRTRCRRRRIRSPPDHGGCVKGPRSMNPHGMYSLPWTHHSESESYSWMLAYYGIISPYKDPWLFQPPVSGFVGLFSS
jgi:hypothetical protein